MSAMRPAVFVSHGAPTLVGEDVPARDFLTGLGATLGRPAAILAVSAHWETLEPRASTAAWPETIHDFGGFPDELYRIRYAAPGAPALAARAVELVKEAGLPAALDDGRGLDHGAWIPLLLMYPEADIPVTQLSIQTPLGPQHHIALGRALAKLRGDDVLVLASGGATHNLHTLMYGRHDAPPAWVVAFDDWITATFASGAEAALADYRAQAPYARQAHPRDEHFLPALVAFGAGGPGAKGKRIHRSFTHGTLSMSAFTFE